ncbi:MAG TPA: trigger factor [Mycobacteriales bacterium]|nr:trigger factor [Mycobacteriales bacterium]
MQSAVETLSPTRVRLAIEAPFAELKPELDEAYRTIGRQVKVQGFRPGKVPPRILDQRVGRAAVLEEAVNHAVSRLYGEAVQEAELVAIGQPDVDITEFTDGERLAFTAEVDVRPEITLPSYDALEVTVDAAEVSAEAIDEQLTSLRERFARLRPVERAATDDDYVTLDLVATIDGEEVPGGTATGLSYRVGAGDLLDGLDDAVRGAKASDARAFTTELVGGEYAGRTADVAVTVTAVNERDLPEADDAWAVEATGFADLTELRTDITNRLTRVRRLEQGLQARDRALEALLAQVEVPVPDSLVKAEVEWRRRDAQQAGDAPDDATLRHGAEQSIKAQFVLDTIADREEIAVTDADLSDQVVRRAQRAGVSPDDYAQRLVDAGLLPGLLQEIRRGKALAAVLESAKVTDSAGASVDLNALRDDLSTGPATPTFADEDGRSYHVHPDGERHYLDEE